VIEQNSGMQGYRNGKGLIYLMANISEKKLAFLRARVILKENNITALVFSFSIYSQPCIQFCSITLQVTSGSSISTPEIRQYRTSAVYLRVVWTSAPKGYHSFVLNSSRLEGIL